MDKQLNFANTSKLDSSSEMTQTYPTNAFTQPQMIKNLENMGILSNFASMNSFILDFFANKLHPTAMLNDGLFKCFIRPILQVVNVELTEQSILNHIIKASIPIKDAIRLRIKQTMIALKIDLVVGPQLIILGIHTQHISEKMVYHYTLSLQQIQSDFTPEKLKNIILVVLHCYEIDINQILITITDLNILDNMDTNAEVVKIVNSFKSTCNDFLHNIGCGHTIPAIKLIQQCINRVLSDPELETHLTLCFDIIQTYNDLHTKRAGGSETYFTVKPPFQCWKSALIMVEQFFELRAKHFHTSDKLRFTMPRQQAQFLEDFIRIFQSIQKYTIKLDDPGIIKTFSQLYIILMELKLVVKKIIKTGLGKLFLDELDKLIATVMQNHIFLTAIYFDPRIRICLDANQTNDVKIFVENLHKKIFALKNKKSANNISITTPANLISANSTSAVKNYSPLQDYLQSLDSGRSQEIEKTRLNFDLSSYELECTNRLPIETDVIEFWHTKKNSLTQLANAVQGIPITQVTMERTLVAYKYITENHLILRDVENILLIKFNCHFQYDN